jgi:excisionase family DNA binding protein
MDACVCTCPSHKPILPRFLTVEEVSQELRLSEAQVYNMINRLELPAIRISVRRLIIERESLDQWIENRAEKIKAY